MRNHTRCLIALNLMVASSLAAAAGNCDNLQTAQDVFDALGSKNPATVLKAQSCGLTSPDKAARGLVIVNFFKNAKSLNLVVDSPTGDKAAADFLPNLPNFTVYNLTWATDNHSFSGGSPTGGGITGTLIEDRMTITYGALPLPNDKGQLTNVACTVMLAPNEKGTALEGPLRCGGHALRFIAQVGM
jgi:hypothetical protein